MFRSRRLTFKDVFIRSGVNIETEPAQLALAKLNEFHSGREADADIFFTCSRFSEGSKEILSINIGGKFMGRAYRVDRSRIGVGKPFLWRVEIDRGGRDWSYDDVWSSWRTLKTKDAKNV